MRSCQEGCKKKPGGNLPGSFLNAHSVHVVCAVVDFCLQLRGVSRRNRCWATSSIFQMTAVALSAFLNRLAASVRSLKAAKGNSCYRRC